MVRHLTRAESRPADRKPASLEIGLFPSRAPGPVTFQDLPCPNCSTRVKIRGSYTSQTFKDQSNASEGVTADPTVPTRQNHE